MNRIRRLAAALAGTAGALLAFAAAAPTAHASQLRPDPPWWLTHCALPVHLPPELPSFCKHPPQGHVVRAAAVGGMPGWQIVLIAAGTALLAPIVAVLLARVVSDRAVHVPEPAVPAGNGQPAPDPAPSPVARAARGTP